LPTVITVSVAAKQKLEEGADEDYEITTKEEEEMATEELQYGPDSGYKLPDAITQEELADLQREVEEDDGVSIMVNENVLG
jgi:hypothetical protein